MNCRLNMADLGSEGIEEATRAAGDEGDTRQNGQPRRMFRFNAARDILLLREVVGQRPFAAEHGQGARIWDQISSTLNSIGMDVTSTTVRGRCAHLKQAFRKEQLAQLRRSGTEEEYDEREQLLQDYIELEEAAESEGIARREERTARDRQREDQGAQLRLAATLGRRRSDVDSGADLESQDETVLGVTPLPKRSRSTPASNYLEFKVEAFKLEMAERQRSREDDKEQKEAELALRGRELDIRDRELDLRRREIDIQRQIAQVCWEHVASPNPWEFQCHFV